VLSNDYQHFILGGNMNEPKTTIDMSSIDRAFNKQADVALMNDDKALRNK